MVQYATCTSVICKTWGFHWKTTILDLSNTEEEDCKTFYRVVLKIIQRKVILVCFNKPDLNNLKQFSRYQLDSENIQV